VEFFACLLRGERLGVGVIRIPTRSLVHISRVVVFHGALIDHGRLNFTARISMQPIDLSRSILLPADSIRASRPHEPRPRTSPPRPRTSPASPAAEARPAEVMASHAMPAALLAGAGYASGLLARDHALMLFCAAFFLGKLCATMMGGGTTVDAAALVGQAAPDVTLTEVGGGGLTQQLLSDYVHKTGVPTLVDFYQSF
jgi:hypothetical protein